MNIVLDEAFEEKAGGEKVAIGMVVRFFCIVVGLVELVLMDDAMRR